MTGIVTDIQLAERLDKSLLEHYQTAVEFMNALPDYSLQQFREFAAGICIYIGKKTNFEFNDATLEKQINILHDSQCISAPMTSTLHELRKLGNEGVHARNFKSNDNSDLKQFRQKLIKKTKSARKLAIEVMKLFYLEYFPEKQALKVELVEEGGQEHKETLFNALITVDWKVKHQAGLLLLKVANEQEAERTTLMVSDTYEAHHDFLLKQAIMHFEAAYKASVNLGCDWEKIRRVSEAKVKSHALAHYAELAPLFNYIELAREGWLGDFSKQEALSLLVTAAERGYAPAIAYYGVELYCGSEGRKPDYKLALRYLLKAEEVNEITVYRFLYYYYSQGKALPVNVEKALDYLNKGIKVGCADCIAELGIAYHKGDLVKHDNVLAKKYLTDSIAAGSILGKNYHTIDFNDLAGQMVTKMKEVGDEWFKELESLNQNTSSKLSGRKPKVNEPCPCGSGKKSKKCCYNPANKN